MSVIKQLMENGEPQYMKAHVKGVDGLPEKLDEYVDKASDETITGQKKFDKVPSVSVDGSDQKVVAGNAEYTLSNSDIYPGSEANIKTINGLLHRVGNFCWLDAYLDITGATVATKAIKLPNGFKRSKRGSYQHSLELTRNASQNEYARALINTDDTAAVRILSGDGSNYIDGGWFTDDPFPAG